MACSLAGKGFTLLHVHDTLTRAYVREQWEQAPPHLAEILPENLKYDMEDATKLQLRTMGCSNPEELIQKYRCVMCILTLETRCKCNRRW